MSRVAISVKGTFQPTSHNGRVFGPMKEILKDQFSSEAIALLRKIWEPAAIAYETQDPDALNKAIASARYHFEQQMNAAFHMLDPASTNIDQCRPSTSQVVKPASTNIDQDEQVSTHFDSRVKPVSTSIDQSEPVSTEFDLDIDFDE